MVENHKPRASSCWTDGVACRYSNCFDAFARQVYRQAVIGRSLRWFVALMVIALSGSNAFAVITLCNDFEHPVWFAVAFQTKDGWVSDGWIKVESKACEIDSKHADLTEFYWRGETDWFDTPGGRTQWSWGNDRKFSVKDDAFVFSNADQSIEGARLVAFIGPVTVKSSAQQVTLTIVDAKGTSTAISSESTALKADPDYQKCQNASGDEAMAACGQAIGSGKFSGTLLANLHINRGIEHQEKKDLDSALADFDEAIRIDPTIPLAFANRASVRYDKKEYDVSIEDLNKAIELDPKYFRAYTDRADAYRQKGDLNHAIEDYKMALSLNPSDKQKVAIEGVLSNAYADRGVDQKDENAELADYDEALRINPNNAVALNNRAATYTSKGEYDKAIQDLDLAVKLRPDYAIAFRNRGDAYRGKGDRKQASADYKLALALNPNGSLKQAIQKALDHLESGGDVTTPKPDRATP
jgi:tetratricopeptide (TPR) repeat protein/uncharacterized membrane protein